MDISKSFSYYRRYENILMIMKMTKLLMVLILVLILNSMLVARMFYVVAIVYIFHSQLQYFLTSMTFLHFLFCFSASFQSSQYKAMVYCLTDFVTNQYKMMAYCLIDIASSQHKMMVYCLPDFVSNQYNMKTTFQSIDFET